MQGRTMSGPSSSPNRTIVGLVALVATLCALVLLPAAQAKSPKPASDYLALGDSLAYGYQAAKFRAEYPNIVPSTFNTGYVDVLGSWLQSLKRPIETTNFGCPGESSDSFRFGGRGSRDGLHLRPEPRLLRRSAGRGRRRHLQQGVVARLLRRQPARCRARVPAEAPAHEPDHARCRGERHPDLPRAVRVRRRAQLRHPRRDRESLRPYRSQRGGDRQRAANGSSAGRDRRARPLQRVSDGSARRRHADEGAQHHAALGRHGPRSATSPTRCRSSTRRASPVAARSPTSRRSASSPTCARVGSSTRPARSRTSIRPTPGTRPSPGSWRRPPRTSLALTP